MTNKEMEQIVTGINHIIEANYSLPGEVTYHAIRNRNRMITEMKEYLEMKDSLIQKYGRKNDSGLYEISSEDQGAFAQFRAEIKEIEKVDIDVNITKISIEKLTGDYPASVIAMLEFMIE